MLAGGSKPTAPAAATKSSCSTPSPLTPKPPIKTPFLYKGTLPGKNTIPLYLSRDKNLGAFKV